MNIIKNNEVKLHYIEQKNNDSNQWVLFIPGAVVSAEQVGKELHNAKFNYYILSLRGRGQSDSPKVGYSLHNQASDIECFINQVDSNIDLTIFAHSIGVPISIIALSNIERKINAYIMCEFAPFYPPFDKNWSDGIKKQKIDSISNVAVDGIVKDAKYIDVVEELKSINTKVHLLVGDNQFSALRDKEKGALQKLLPNLNIKSIKGGHELLEENNIQTLAFIDSVLNH